MAKELYSEEIEFCGRRVRIVLVEYEVFGRLRQRVQAKLLNLQSPRFIIPDKEGAKA